MVDYFGPLKMSLKDKRYSLLLMNATMCSFSMIRADV